MAENTIQILLVEDDEVDAEAIQRAFKKYKIANPVHRASDGIEALEILRGLGGRQALTWPYLILLDINMPRMNGIEFLNELRKDSHLNDAIVFVLTTSNNDKDKLSAYDRNIAGYMLKSRAGEDFIHLIEMLKFYWRYVEFPPRKN